MAKVTIGHAAVRGTGKYRHSLYRVWWTMLNRCHNPKATSYPRYGALGVTVCERWRSSFVAFLEDMGERPDGLTESGRAAHSIDRIDISRGYEPGNCRWATLTEQARNKRKQKLQLHEAMQIRWLREEGFSLKEIAGAFSVSISMVSQIHHQRTWRDAS